jgi:hypothetical protein
MQIVKDPRNGFLSIDGAQHTSRFLGSQAGLPEGHRTLNRATMALLSRLKIKKWGTAPSWT